MDSEPIEAELRTALNLRNRQINAVHHISRVLSSSLDLDDRLRDIMTISLEAVDAGAGTIYLYRPNDDKLVFRLVVGPKAAELTGRVMNATDGLAGAVFQSSKPAITNSPREAEGHDPTVGESIGFAAESLVTVPLKYQAGRPVGVMQILNKRDGEFDTGDLEVLEIVAAIAATAIENAQLHKDAQLSAVAHAVGDLSHDIKNMVTPISGWIHTLQPTFDSYFESIPEIVSEASVELASRLKSSASEVQELYLEGFEVMSDKLLDLQEFAKLIADAVKGIVTEPQLEPHDPCAIVAKQLDSLEQMARTQGLTIVREFHDVPTCRFDRFHVERAVYNLVHNAIPETPAGGSIFVTVTCSLEGRFPTGRYLLIEVRDTGRGMPPEVLERILLGDPKSTKAGGTGLGTKIVFNAVAAHHGRFEGESQEGVGTTFRMRLPLLIDE